LHQVQAETPLPPMDTPIMAGDKEIGVMRSVQGNQGLAVLRIEEAASAATLTAARVAITAKIPDWFSVPTGAINA
jgi:folate-binding Fe-S cluster repair protein YgfZ